MFSHLYASAHQWSNIVSEVVPSLHIPRRSVVSHHIHLPVVGNLHSYANPFCVCPHHLSEMPGVFIKTGTVEVVVTDLTVPVLDNLLCGDLGTNIVEEVLSHALVVTMPKVARPCQLVRPLLGGLGGLVVPA